MHAGARLPRQLSCGATDLEDGRPRSRLSGGRFVVAILAPAAFPHILFSLRIGWTFAWRTLIAAEVIFGVSARSGGLWLVHLHQPRANETASVSAGLLTVILIGLIVGGVIFRTLTKVTLQRGGQEKS